MKNVKIKIGNSNLFYGNSPTYCYEEHTIILRKAVNEGNIELTLNHEYLHAILHQFISKKTSIKLDNFFYNKKGECIKGYNLNNNTLEGIDEYGVPI